MPTSRKKAAESEPQEAPTQELPKEDRDAVVRKSYQHAGSELQKRHLDEFNQLRVDYCKANGVAWTPPLTAEQRAERELQTLFDANPELAKLYQRVEPAEEPA